MSVQWQAHAACATTDPELFFPLPGSADEQRAKAICGQCPVATSCLSYALQEGLNEGVWGGLTPQERDQRERRRRGGDTGELAMLPPSERQVILQRLDAGETAQSVAAAAGVRALTIVRVWAQHRDYACAGASGLQPKDRAAFGLWFDTTA